MSATADTAVTTTLHTVIDVIPEGDENPGPVQTVDLTPNGTTSIGTWTDLSGGTTNLYLDVDDDIDWPDSTVAATGIQDTGGFSNILFTFDASAFDTGGALDGARVCGVSIATVAGANTGFRSIRFELETGGSAFNLLGGATAQQVHGFGAIYDFGFGELNVDTTLPWVPADVVEFDTTGTWTVRVRSQSASVSNYPIVYALALRVHYIETENRVAVGKWQRPTSVSSTVIEPTTDDLISVPDGTADWAKTSGENFLFWWRQARSPYLHEASSASDVRWRLLRQALGSAGNPPGEVFPLTTTPSSATPGDDVLAGDILTSDSYGLPAGPHTPPEFRADSPSAAAIVLNLAAGVSDDSQPYAPWPVADAATFGGSDTVGQEVTPSATASFLGVRTVVHPPSSGGGTFTAAVYRVSDGQQIGGQLSITADEVRSLPEIPLVTSVNGEGGRFIEGFLSAAATLASGVDYEIRLAASGGEWTAYAPFKSIGPAASFSGASSGAYIGGSLDTDRDLLVNLLVQPDPPQNVTAETVDVATDTYLCSADHVEHVQVTWDPGATPLGVGFDRFEIERQILAAGSSVDCEPSRPSMLHLDGTSGTNVTAPDTSGFTVGAQTLQATIEAEAVDWSPAGGKLLVGQWTNVAGENSWVLALTNLGELNFAFGDDTGAFAAGNQRTSTTTISTNGFRSLRVVFTPNDGTGTLADSMDGDGDADTVTSTSHVAPSVTAAAVGDLLICAWLSWEETPQTYTEPGSMTAGTITRGFWGDMLDATEVLAASGATGTRTATYGTADAWSAVSAVVFGDGATPTVEETLSGVATDTDLTLSTSAATEAGEWLVAVYGVDWDPNNQMGSPSGSGWQLVADSGFQATGTSRTMVWARRLETGGAKDVTFPTVPTTTTEDVHGRLYRLSGVLTVDNDIVEFYESLDGVTFTQVGSTVTTASGGVAVFDSAGDMVVGGAGGQELEGDVRGADVAVGGVTVASPDFTAADPGDLSVTDDQGNVWTLNTAAEIIEDPEAALVFPDDPECAWQQVAVVSSSEGVGEFVDREVPRGATAVYRVRAVATTGATSEWVQTGEVSPSAVGCEIIFTSNSDPDLELVYDRLPEQRIQFLAHDGTEIVQIYGADFQVAFMEPENRGLGMRTEVTVNFGTQPTDPAGNQIGGRAVFAPLDRLTRTDTVPYVAVLDHDGNAWYAHVTLTEGVYEQPGHRYTLPVTVTPVTDTATPAEL